jgi:cobyrinic acid a,c-diamide synthase
VALYAECGGLMLLGRSLVDADGQRHTMAGVVPLDTTLAGQRLTIGYREATAARRSPLLEAGETVRAHEFHWSALERPAPAPTAAYVVDNQTEGYAWGSTLASYLHLHLATTVAGTSLAERFVARAAHTRGLVYAS